jgi:hyperosmotically inducible protein
MRDWSRPLGIAIAALCAAWGAPLALAAQPADAWITTKAKIALLTAEGLDGLGIDVDTFDGRVTLHGSAGSERQADAALERVRHVDGVRGVRDLLVVVPTGR